jgi:hypothetical protein
LEHRLYRSKRTGRAIYRWPPVLLFPPHLIYDALQPLRVLAMLGVRVDGRLDEALDLLEARADTHGRWPADGTPAPPSRDPALALRIDDAGRPNKWVTVHAVAVLRHFGRATFDGDGRPGR